MNEYTALTAPEKERKAQEKEFLPSISNKSAFPKETEKVNYSLAKTATDQSGKIINFDDIQTALMNTIDECLDTGHIYMPLNHFIKRHYHSESYEPDDNQRKLILEHLKDLSLLSGMWITQKDDNIDVNIGPLIPIRLNVRMKVNGKIVDDGITIMDHTCIHGIDTHKVEYWRLQFPNPRMRKTERNIRISRKVLESHLKGDNVNITELCSDLGIDDPQARQKLINFVLQCINHQRQYTNPEPTFIYDTEGDGAGRPAIKAIDTK